MGEVYRAADTNLKRHVALKVLPDALASDAERLARFQREAEVLASLNHPNIAILHGLEKSNGVIALVMELVEGPTLADRLVDGAIPVDEALAIARQIAEALEAAHERGIIHRDLKPANVKVRPDGTVNVLDFGLAKAMEPVGSAPQTSAHMSLSPTITSPAMTQAGMILGTAAYMSPEQAKGKGADKRSDVWAFGAVLYEMLTGRRAFDGEDMVDVLGAVARMEPDWSLIPAGVPLPVTTLLKACLVKDPRRRVGEMAGVLFVLNHLDSLLTSSSAPASTQAAELRRRTLWVAAAAFVLCGVAVGSSLWLARPSSSADVTRSTISLTSDLRLSGEGVALSPDGRTLAIPAGNRLVLRRLDRDESTTLPGTEGATTPFFSPDGVWVGFVANNELRKVRLDGSTPTTIARGTAFIGGRASWSADDTITYGSIGGGLFRVPAAGGIPAPLTEPRQDVHEVGHTDPQVLPGGRSILFTVMKEGGGVGAVLDLDTREWRTLPEVGGGATYLDGGYIAFFNRNTLLASRFDPVAGRSLGSPVPVMENVGFSFAVASNGTLAFRSSGDVDSILTVRGRIQIADRSGRTTIVAPDNPVILEAGGGLAFDPKNPQRFLATVRDPDPISPAHIWLYDLSRPGTRIRLTMQGFINAWPIWDPEGTRFAFTSIRPPMGIYAQAPDPAAPATLLLARRDELQNPQAWAPDGSLLLYQLSRKTGLDIVMLDTKGATSTLVATPAAEMRPRVSSDGQWLAYESDGGSGQMEVYVRPFRGDGRTDIVSRGGGTDPRWVGSSELLYRRGRKVLSVRIAPKGGQLNPGQERELFEIDDYPTHFDVSADGTKFLILRREPQSAGTTPGQVHLVLNWREELKRLVPR
jgi:eukaryotic-like serine/threonine-protein kinase